MKLSKEQIKQKLLEINEVTSVSGRSSYHSIKFVDENVQFIRKGKSEIEQINFEKLYELYYASGNCRPKTPFAKSIIKKWQQSPAVAILAKIMES